MKPYDTPQLVMRAVWMTTLAVLILAFVVNVLIWPTPTFTPESGWVGTVAGLFLTAFVTEPVYFALRRRARARGHLERT